MKPKSIMFATMTIHDANNRLLFQLYHLYNNSEAANIADMVMEKITGWKRIDRVLNKQVKLSAVMTTDLERYIELLMQHKPVQYVLNEAWFYGLQLYVDENVLIPRPETEELVEWVLKETMGKAGTILDIGTGSGCVPIALKKNLPESKVFTCDVSEKAIDVARKNAETNKVSIELILADVLLENEWKKIPVVDVIVSNPPYIPFSEKEAMDKNVTAHEPHLALFVPDDDPMIFYRAIATLGKSKLKEGGKIFVEVHEGLAEEVVQLFAGAGYTDVKLKIDMQGKRRFVRSG